jgi:hypothetical protein
MLTVTAVCTCSGLDRDIIRTAASLAGQVLGRLTVTHLTQRAFEPRSLSPHVLGGLPQRAPSDDDATRTQTLDLVKQAVDEVQTAAGVTQAGLDVRVAFHDSSPEWVAAHLGRLTDVIVANPLSGARNWRAFRACLHGSRALLVRPGSMPPPRLTRILVLWEESVAPVILKSAPFMEAVGQIAVWMKAHTPDAVIQQVTRDLQWRHPHASLSLKRVRGLRFAQVREAAAGMDAAFLGAPRYGKFPPMRNATAMAIEQLACPVFLGR